MSVAADGGEPTRPTLKRADAKPYRADTTVRDETAPAIENLDYPAFVEAAKKGEVELKCSFPLREGGRELVHLDAATSQRYLAGDPAERARIGNQAIRESRFREAVAAAQRNGERGVPIRVPLEEARLREFGMVVDRRVPRVRGHGFDVLPFLRETVRRGADKLAMALREDGFWDGVGIDGGGGFGYGGAYGTMVSAGARREYLPIGGPAQEQQTIADVWRTLSLARYAYVHDVNAHHGCHVLADFVLGRGVDVVAVHPAVQRVLDGFMGRVKLNERMHEFAVALCRDGELFIRKIMSGDGSLDIVPYHPATIWEITCDGENVNRVYSFHQRYATRAPAVFTQTPGTNVTYIERVIPAAEMLHVKINASSWDVRGRSDMFPALAALKRLRDYLDAAVQKEIALASYQWHYSVNGGSGDVANISAAISGEPAPPGSSFVTNDAVKVEAVASKAGGESKEGGIYEAFLNEIAKAFGLSKDYFGASNHATRASALVATEPAAKRFEQRQGVLGAFLDELLRAAIAEQKRTGGGIKLLPGEDRNIDEGFRVVFPSIITADSTEKMTQLGVGLANGVISHQRYAQEVVGELEIDDYDYDEEQDLIESEIGITGAAFTSKANEMVKRGLPAATDPAFSPGDIANPADKPADPASTDPPAPNPRSSAARGKALADKPGDRRGLGEMARRLSEAGAVVILP